MKLTIFQDAKRKPQLFRWNGSIDKLSLSRWLKEKDFVFPEDIFNFYCITGGGDIFEGETILNPFRDNDIGDSLEEMNNYHWSKGMPRKYLAFHIGLGISVIDMWTKNYNVLDKSYQITSIYENFEEWYVHYLRDEYFLRYDL